MGCRGRETLQNLCDQIPGDALLYSMFKVDAEPIKCPIRGMGKIFGKISSTGWGNVRKLCDGEGHLSRFRVHPTLEIFEEACHIASETSLVRNRA